MSWKGFKKALERMPHQLQTKIGRGAKTVDSDYEDLKLRFVDLETVAKTLFLQAAQFRDSIRATLVYQTEYLEQIPAVYRPITIDPDGAASHSSGNYVDEGASPELLRVAEEFRTRVAAIKERIDPQLESLDISVIGPIQELLAMMRNVHRVMQKREHKMIDYDRFRSAVEKYEKKEVGDAQRSLPDEKAYQKYGAQYQEASRQYNYYNDMLKAELKQLLDLRQAFIDPIFMRFFRIQRRLYADLFREFSEAARNCPAFDLTTPVVIGWQNKWPRAEQSLETIDLWGQGFMQVEPYKVDTENKGFVGSLRGTFRKKDKAPSPVAAGSFSQSPAQPSPPPLGGASTATRSNDSSVYGHGASSVSPYAGQPSQIPEKQLPLGASLYQQPQQIQQPQYQPPPTASKGTVSPPAYDAIAANAKEKASSQFNTGYGAGSSSVTPPLAAASTATTTTPTCYAPNPTSGQNAKYVVAIYDYTAQADGDLTFREGDRIELVNRTPSKDDWWTGSLNGVTGIFPGTYVEEI